MFIPEFLNNFYINNNYYELKLANYKKALESYLNKDILLKSFPLKLTIQNTTSCNLFCKMCLIKRPNLSPYYIDFEIINKISYLLPYILEIHLSNIGEPLVDKNFIRFIDLLKKYGVLLDFTTNGTLLTKKIITDILPILKDIKISFDSPHKKELEKIRSGVEFEKLVENIKSVVKMRDEINLKTHKPTITLQATLRNDNIDHLIDLIYFAKELNVDAIKGFFMFSFYEELDNFVISDFIKYNKIHEQVLNLGKKLGINVDLSEPFLLNDRNDNLASINCPLLWFNSWINYNGDIYACHSGIKIDNLNNGDFSHIWNSNKYISLRTGNDSYFDDCYNCGSKKLKLFENQPIIHDLENFKSNSSNIISKIRWSGRFKQFQEDNE